MSRKPSYIELFSGAGLLSYAFSCEGFQAIEAVESDPTACATYSKNIGEHVTNCLVEDYEPKFKADLLIAGPPCQGFSTLNRNRHLDPRNQLCLHVARVAKTCKPKVVIVENVEPFALSDECRRLARSLKKQGYKCDVAIEDAVNYGTAQYRRRCFLIASIISAEFKLCELRSPPVSVMAAWKKMPSRKRDREMQFSPQPSSLALLRFNVIPPGGDRRDILSIAPHLAPVSWKRLRPSSNTGVWGRMSWDDPSNTIRTCFQNPSKGRYIHPEENRVISLREGARLQGIPDTWKFAGSHTQITRQIGNGVPIPMGRALAKKIKELFF